LEERKINEPTKKNKTMAKKTSHPGFKAVQKKIASKQGVSMESAGKILASAGRKASAKAKTKNPNLMKISGNKKKK
jgi:hypothetical protein